MATHLRSIIFLMILNNALRYCSWMFELIQYWLFGIRLPSRCFCFASQWNCCMTVSRVIKDADNVTCKKKVYWQYCHIILSVLFSNTEHYAYISIFSFWHNPNNYLPFFLTRKQNKAPDRFFLLRGHLIICEPRSQLQYCIQSYTESSQLQYFRLYLLHLILQFYTAHSVWEEFHFHICFINLNCSFSFKRVSV